MKYIDISTVVNSYEGFQNCMTNKSWGYLALLKGCNNFIRPSVSYEVDMNVVSNFLEGIFNLSSTKRQYNGGRSLFVVFSNVWENYFNDQGQYSPNIYDIAAWAYRRKAFDDNVTEDDMIKNFTEEFHIPSSVIEKCFDTKRKGIKFTNALYLESDLKSELRRIGVDVSRDNIDAKKGSVVASPGEISRGPFVQTLYAGLDITEYVLILQSDYESLYGSKTEKESIKDSVLFRQSLQQIFYGAPGTGKSHEIKEKTEGKAVVRTTFHPDSDYSTFVGAYKPAMKTPERDYSFEELIAKLNEIKLSGVTYPCHKFSAQYWKSLKKLTPEQIKQMLKACGFTDTMNVEVGKGMAVGEELSAKNKEEQIVYKFIPQAFLKAYLGAWKKYADRATRTSVPVARTFKINDGEYTITGVNTNDISFHRVFPFNISHSSVGRVWDEIWSTGSFVIPTGAQPGVSVQQAIAQWIYDNVQNCTKQSLAEGLESLKKSIEEKGQVSISRSSQTYTLSKKENGYFIDTDGKCSKTKIQDYYNGNEPESGARGLQRYFANLLKEIDSSSFENAWNRLADAINKNTDKVDLQAEESVLEPQFLVIEEINRGNCAQIFGDLFQLLDRGDNGFSEYPIEADTDLQQEIERAFKEEYKLYNDINIEGVVEGYTSNYGATLSEDVQSGRVLLLPNNLYIWATMNTSDQSLFPIDSAFKRRWDWEYLPIENAEKGWEILVNNHRYDWYRFLNAINKEVYNLTHSEDKQLGYFFAKAKDGLIDAKTLVNKVYFYLWTDVFKDYDYESQTAFRDPNKNKPIAFKDFFKSGQELDEEMAEQVLLNLKLDKPEESAE